MQDQGDLAGLDAVGELARMLRRLRRARGLSQRALIAPLHLASHSTIADYEAGRRIPPADVLIAYERFFAVTRGELTRRRERALAARAAREAATCASRFPGSRAGNLVPMQLPPLPNNFVGRDDVLSRLDQLLKPPSSPGLVIISGMGGVGKTSLAVHWAHQVAGRFPDGQIFMNLRGFDPDGAPVTPEQAVRGFLDALDVPPERIPASPAAQASFYRSLLAERRALIVADNARDEEQVRPLLPATSMCLMLVTSRSQLTGLVVAEGACPLTLDALTGDEAIQLLSRRIGAERVADDVHSAEEIAQRCARLPLALSVVAARAAAHPDYSLATLAAELRGAAPSRLDALDGGTPATGVRTVFSWSYQQLDRQAARLFRVLGLHPGPDITAAAAASLTGQTRSEARRAMTALAGMHLVSEHVPGRFTCHDLLREFAAELARALEPRAEQAAAVHRMLDHYLRSAYSATLLLDAKPVHGPIVLPAPSTGATPEEDIADAAAARAWFEAERLVLLGVIAQAAASAWHTHAWQLAWSLRDHLAGRGYFHDLLACQRTALAAAGAAGDRQGVARAHSGVGSALGWLGQHSEACVEFGRALMVFEELNDIAGQATMHLDLGWVLSNQGRNAEAFSRAEQALALYRAAGDRNGQAQTLSNIGWSLVLLGDHSGAVARCEQALALQQELGERRSEARTLDNLGYALHHLGDYRRAITFYQRAIALCREHADRYYEANALDHLGDAHCASGEEPAARTAWRQAAAIFEEIGHAHAEETRAKLRQ
jgi:tetratricopeptide (TPR) repeat protein/transcriptional regulator with XRE-family HTH domain